MPLASAKVFKELTSLEVLPAAKMILSLIRQVYQVLEFSLD